MAFRISNYRNKTFEYDKDDIQFKLFFEFPYKEERDYDTIREKLQGKELKSVAVNLSTHTVRKSLICCEGIVDEQDNPINIKNPDGTINEHIQLEVFEQVTNLPGVFEKLFNLYHGITEKNS